MAGKLQREVPCSEEGPRLTTQAYTSTVASSAVWGVVGEGRRSPYVIFSSSQQSLTKCKMAFLARHKDLVKNQ